MEQVVDAPSGALNDAVAYWQRRGYRVTYRDAYLVQLLRRDAPYGVLTVIALAVIAAIAMTSLVRRTRRRWHIVSLAVTEDGRVVAHHQWAAHPPPL